MGDPSLVVAAVAVALSLVFLVVAARASRKPGKLLLPPGSMGLPVIGQSLGFLRALRSNTAEQWIQERVERYGPVSKLRLFGTRTVMLTGPAANKFVFTSASLGTEQPQSTRRIVGERQILELMGADHKRVRGALLEFLKPDMLRLYVGKIDGEVRRHLDEYWAGRATVTVMPLMKRLTFDIISLLLFGLERGAVREALFDDFEHVLDGVWSVPLDLPFTAYRRSLRASASARRVIAGITRETKAKLERGEASRSSDLVACLLSLTDGSGARLLSDQEVVDNAMASMIAGHDTSSILLAFLIRQLADDPDTLAAMVHEHEEIAKSKGDGDTLTWEDLSKMKFTWRAAQEMLRLVPPIFGTFRTALKDIEFNGYLIPKGWKVLWTAPATHMDGSIYPEPAKFNPSRFENPTAPPCSFVAFGGGPRICVGMEFARIETLVAMHYLVRRFSWKLCCKENTFVRNIQPWPLHGLPVQLEQKAAKSP